jgi:hypothetical protein
MLIAYGAVRDYQGQTFDQEAVNLFSGRGRTAGI